MVILVINENRVLALERKCEPPVPAHPHGPVPLQVTLRVLVEREDGSSGRPKRVVDAPDAVSFHNEQPEEQGPAIFLPKIQK